MTYTGTSLFDLQVMVDQLVYASYAEQRRLNSETSPERWTKLYGQQVYEMERKFQAEQEIYSAYDKVRDEALD